MTGKLSPLPDDASERAAAKAVQQAPVSVSSGEGLADAVADVILLVSTDGVVRSANLRAKQVAGRNPVGMRLADLFGVWAIAGFGDLIANPPETPQEIEAPLFSADGKALGFLWLIRTHGKGQVALAGREMQHVYPLDLLRRLSERVDALRDSNRAKQDLLDMVAHEFKTPLTVIKGYAWLLAQNGEDLAPDQTGEALNRIQSAADRLLQLFDDVFIVSQIDSGRLTVHPAEVDLVSLVGELCATLAATRESRTLEFAAPVVASACQDPSKVGQVVCNLVTNAIKYSPAGSPIKVTLDGTPDRWRIRVFNEHAGLSPVDIDSLFERFSRLERDPRVEGRGLGLYIARNLARKLEGEIRVESSPGVGVTFVFEFPDLKPLAD